MGFFDPIPDPTDEKHIKRVLAGLAQGYCQCDFKSHGHPDGKHNKPFSDFKGEPQYVRKSLKYAFSIDNGMLVCPPCYRKISSAYKIIR